MNSVKFLSECVFLLLIWKLHSQYQHTRFLRGSKLIDQQPIFGSGSFDELTSPGGCSYSSSLLSNSAISNNKEVLLFYGWTVGTDDQMWASDGIWKYSFDLNQWKYQKGRKDEIENLVPVIIDEHNFHVDNQIGGRCGQTTWKLSETSDHLLVGIFGGWGYHNLTTEKDNLNDLWIYNSSSNSYSLLSIASSTEEFYGYYNTSTLNDYDPLNRPGARFLHGHSKINSDELFVLGGYGYFHQNFQKEDYLADWWMYSSSLNSWKYLGGNLFSTKSPMHYTEKNQYHANNTFGSRDSFSAVLINDEEILVFAGETKEENKNYLQKYNITSNMWKFIGSTSDGYSTVAENKYEFSPDNFPSARVLFKLIKINENEVLLFGGYGWSKTNDIGQLSDEWIFDTHLNHWKFIGKELSIYPGSFSVIGSTDDFSHYSETTQIGGINRYIAEYMEDDIGDGTLFVYGGYGQSFFDRGNLDNSWLKYYGKVCFQYQHNNPYVCSGNGLCVDNNQCVCTDGYYGENCEIAICFNVLSNDTTNVCSNNGICHKINSCLCFDNFIYTNPDCSVNESLENFIENLWIFISVSIIILGLLTLISVAICIFIGVTTRQKKKLKKFDQIEDIEIILEEQKIANSKTPMCSSPKFEINKGLFEINPKEIKLIEVIGDGGSDSQVFKALYKNETVAYKLFNIQNYLEDKKFEEFEKEVAILASISFPYILAFYGVTLSKKIGIVMEFAENGDLEFFLRKYKKLHNDKSYPIAKKMKMLSQITSSMMFLHSKDIIHRDLKPLNILVTDKEEAKLMDFGLSRLILTDENTKTMTKTIGTSFYMAPEILKGKYSYPCDVYSFAMLAFVVLTENFYPFGSNGLSSSLSFYQNPNLILNYEELKTKNVSEDLIQLIQQNTNVDPSKRMKFEEINKILNSIIEKRITCKTTVGGKEEDKKNRIEEMEKRIIDLKKEIKNQELMYENKILKLEEKLKNFVH